jgi:hypothetical protein
MSILCHITALGAVNQQLLAHRLESHFAFIYLFIFLSFLLSWKSKTTMQRTAE